MIVIKTTIITIGETGNEEGGSMRIKVEATKYLII